MEYLSLKQTAEKWGITVRRVQVLCSQDRIFWVVPKEAEKPKDQRIKSGKYIKSSKK